MSVRATTPLEHAREALDACVHCGFCLPACPTYLALGDENDSPRGRIVLMRAAIEGTMAIADPALSTHLERCLGCRACETACPSGVRYGAALEAVRETLADPARGAVRRTPFIERILYWLLDRPRAFRAAMAMARALRASRLPWLLARLGGRFGFPFAMLAASAETAGSRVYRPPGSGPGSRVALLRGCVMEGLFAHVHRATERALAMNDFTVVPAEGQWCCGALEAHGGHAARARERARALIDVFDRSGAHRIVVNAAGCGAMMKEYGRLLADDPAWAARAAAFASRVHDVSGLLAIAGPRPGAAVHRRATYAAPCHLLHAQRVAWPPLSVLKAIPGLDLVPLEDADQCCGSAGTFNLLQPAIARAVLARKLERIVATEAEVVATGNPGCQMQIGAGLIQAGSSARVMHPVELLDRSYAEAVRAGKP